MALPSIHSFQVTVSTLCDLSITLTAHHYLYNVNHPHVSFINFFILTYSHDAQGPHLQFTWGAFYTMVRGMMTIGDTTMTLLVHSTYTTQHYTLISDRLSSRFKHTYRFNQALMMVEILPDRTISSDPISARFIELIRTCH